MVVVLVSKFPCGNLCCNYGLSIHFVLPVHTSCPSPSKFCKLCTSFSNSEAELTGCLVQSCQVDLVKDSGHWYFIRFLDSVDVLPEQRAMAAFNLAVIVDGHPRGQQACIQANLIGVCLSHIQEAANVSNGDSEPLLLQWLCLCLGKLWEGSSDGIAKALDDNAPEILGKVLSEPQPEVCR